MLGDALEWELRALVSTNARRLGSIDDLDRGKGLRLTPTRRGVAGAQVGSLGALRPGQRS